MKLTKAAMTDFDTVFDICYRCIDEYLYRFYPQKALEYFFDHHNRERVQEAIEKGQTYIYYDDANEPVGTISIDGDYIFRFFLLPEHQQKGYGSYMMDFCEQEIFKTYGSARLDSSLCAYNMYLHRGYILDEYVLYDCGDILCYFAMHKDKQAIR